MVSVAKEFEGPVNFWKKIAKKPNFSFEKIPLRAVIGSLYVSAFFLMGTNIQIGPSLSSRIKIETDCKNRKGLTPNIVLEGLDQYISDRPNGITVIIRDQESGKYLTRFSASAQANPINHSIVRLSSAIELSKGFYQFEVFDGRNSGINPSRLIMVSQILAKCP